VNESEGSNLYLLNKRRGLRLNSTENWALN